MGASCTEVAATQSAQKLFFRLAERDHGITQKMVSLATGYCRTVVGQWARGETSMGLPAYRKLLKMKEVPSDLLSILIDGTDRHIVDGEDDSELDTIGENADQVAAAVRRARHPASPGGVEITEDEEALIRTKVVQFRGRVA